MTELHVTGKGNSLGGSDISKPFEDDHSDGAFRKDITTNQFIEDLNVCNLLVGDSLEHGHGESED